MTALRNVVFDVGNVLLRWDPAATVAAHVEDPALARRLLHGMFLHQDWSRLDEGRLEEQEAVALFCERTAAPSRLVRTLMDASKTSLSPIAESLELLDEVGERGLRRFCLTNMSHATFRYLRVRDRFWEKFEGIVVSALVGLIKPDPAIFRRLLDTYGLEPAETFFLDDNPANVEGARAVGMVAEVYRSADRVRDRIRGPSAKRRDR
jgi:FMN phosphatase YigB (HAD superfamily)